MGCTEIRGVLASEKHAVVIVPLGNPSRVAQNQAAGRDILGDYGTGTDGCSITNLNISANLRMRTDPDSRADYRALGAGSGIKPDMLLYCAACSHAAMRYMYGPKMADVQARPDLCALFQVDAVGEPYSGCQHLVNGI